MKRFLSYLFTLMITLWSTPIVTEPAMPPIDPFELLNNMDPKELDQILDSLAKMSPEEIKYYEDLGKQMFKESGYDLDEIEKSLGKPAQAPAPKPVVVESKTPTTTLSKEREAESSSKEKSALLRMVKQLSDSLASIRQKAATDETLNPIIASLHYDLDLFTAYINRFDYERHLKHFEDKEFAPLKTKLRKMSLTLEELDANLSVPPLKFYRQNPGQDAKKEAQKLAQAKSVLEQFKNYMRNAFTSDTIITDIENLFKKYDKEALEIKKKLEEQQKKASEQAKKLPTTNTGHFAPIPKYNQPAGNRAPNTSGGNYGGGNYNAGASRPNTMTPTASQPGQPQQPNKPQTPEAKAKEEQAKKDKAAKDAKDKEKEMVEVPLTLEERIEKIKGEFRTVNVRIGQHKTELLKIASDINHKTNATPPVSDPIIPQEEALDMLDQQINRIFKELQEDLTKFLKDADSKDPKKLKQFKTDLKTVFNATALPDLEQLKTEYATASQVGLTGNAGTNPLAQDAVKLMKKFMEIYNSINTKLSSTRASI